VTSVLFLCTENACRSQIAEAFAHRHNPGTFAIYSSGSAPSGVVNPKAVSSMEKVGYDLASHSSKPVSSLDAARFDIIISMGCGDKCPELAAPHREDWGIPDPKHLDESEFDRIRDSIEAKVLDLYQRLALA
jgi:protein-tyrosine-phosphatase